MDINSLWGFFISRKVSRKRFFSAKNIYEVKFCKHLTEDFSETEVVAGIQWEHIKIDIKKCEGANIFSKSVWNRNLKSKMAKTLLISYVDKT